MSRRGVAAYYEGMTATVTRARRSPKEMRARLREAREMVVAALAPAQSAGRLAVRTKRDEPPMSGTYDPAAVRAYGIIIPAYASRVGIDNRRQTMVPTPSAEDRHRQETNQ